VRNRGEGDISDFGITGMARGLSLDAQIRVGSNFFLPFAMEATSNRSILGTFIFKHFQYFVFRSDLKSRPR
jgi:hypothetical protein